MLWHNIHIVGIILLVILGSTRCQDNLYSTDSSEYKENSNLWDKPTPTYVSIFEKFVITLRNRLDFLGSSVNRIAKSFGDLAFQLPGIRDIPRKKPAHSLGDILNPIKDKVKAVYPGTYWCGGGDIADDDDDLGLFNRTDACCRAHDSCPDSIPAEEVRHNLLNNGLFTRSHCDCDEAFYRCLKEAKSPIATKIGTTYFNVLRPQCFRKECSIVYCKKYTGNRLLDDKCAEYKLDCNKPKKYQWFDNADFLG